MKIPLLVETLAAASGGLTFARAIARGDIAPDAAIAHRRAVCRGCPSSRIDAPEGVAKPSSWCGKPLTPDDGPPKTCGCLLWGKTMVASEACPQGKWPAVDRRDRQEADDGVPANP